MKELKYDYDALCAWLGELTRPGEILRPLPGAWPEVSLCTASAGVEGSVALVAAEATKTAQELIDEFRKESAQRIYLFCSPSISKKTLANAVLDIDANLLDASILLPASNCAMTLDGHLSRVSLLVLDKGRTIAGRTLVTFIDASNLRSRPGTDHLQAAPKVEKDFRDILLRKESLVASRHCALPMNGNTLGRPCKPLIQLADVIRSPAYYAPATDDEDEIVHIPILSPRDFEPYGYTNPEYGVSEGRWYKRDEVCDHEAMIVPSDIIIVGQRNVGKSAIIDPSFVGVCFATSFNYIVRCHEGTDPHVLFMYISSNAVRKWFNVLATSSGTTPILRIDDLRSLPVPEFSAEELVGMTDAFKRLEELRGERGKINSEAWDLQHKFFSE